VASKDLVGDREVLVDRFVVDVDACVNNNTHEPRPPSKVDESKQIFDRLPDMEKIKTWANVLNLHQYGYGTDRFARALIKKNQEDMVRFDHLSIPKPAGTCRIVSYNVHAFLNSFACILPTEGRGRPVTSGPDVAALVSSLDADIICFQEFTGLPWKNTLRLHGFKHLFNGIHATPITEAAVTQGELSLPNFLGVATFAVGRTAMHTPVVGRSRRSNIRPPYDEPYRIFLCTTVVIHGTTVKLWNIHPEAASFSKAENEAQLRTLFRDLEHDRDPVLVVGDYNCQDILPFLHGTSFQPHPGQWHSPPPSGRPAYTSWAGSYIDHVCSNGAFRNVLDATVSIVRADLSDHFLVQIDVKRG
jgi:endonuclease/exonuclease/phosphatase family metal-dependent hydrolase